MFQEQCPLDKVDILEKCLAKMLSVRFVEIQTAHSIFVNTSYQQSSMVVEV